MARGGIDRLFRACVAGVLVMAPVAPAAARTVEVKLVQTADGRAYFDPVGVHIQAGDTVRWIQVSGFHSVTAYHPRNYNH